MTEAVVNDIDLGLILVAAILITCDILFLGRVSHGNHIRWISASVITLLMTLHAMTRVFVWHWTAVMFGIFTAVVWAFLTERRIMNRKATDIKIRTRKDVWKD